MGGGRLREVVAHRGSTVLINPHVQYHYFCYRMCHSAQKVKLFCFIPAKKVFFSACWGGGGRRG